MLKNHQINELLKIYNEIENTKFCESYRAEFLSIMKKGTQAVLNALKKAKTKREQAVYCYCGRLNGIKEFYLEEERAKCL